MKYKIIYGTEDIAIIDAKTKEEIVYWHREEWEEDPEVVFSIANAIELAYKGTLKEKLECTGCTICRNCAKENV